MTVSGAINDCKEKRPNQFSDEDLIKWLSDVELDLVHSVFGRYEGFEQEKAFTGYTPQTQADTQLLAPAPFDNLYRYWLYAMVDLHNNDITRYNMAATLFLQQLEAFKIYMVQKNKPLNKTKITHVWMDKQPKGDVNNPLG